MAEASKTRTGADVCVARLAQHGIDTWFANPGTSELHLVDAIGERGDNRAVLCLFEGVATGAADGYCRMSNSPCAALLHLGPGLANGLANLHNAKRAGSQVIAVVGDHPDSHLAYDTPLTSDIVSLATPMSVAVERIGDQVSSVVDCVLEAARKKRGPATVILPADIAWLPSSEVDSLEGPEPASELSHHSHAGDVVLSKQTTFILGGIIDDAVLDAASKLAKTGQAKILIETFPARLARGAGRPTFEKLAYFGDMASAQLAGSEQIVLVDAPYPASFFAYPGKPADLVPAQCDVATIDKLDFLALVDQGDCTSGSIAGNDDTVPSAPKPVFGDDAQLDQSTIGSVLAARMPRDSIIVDEATTNGLLPYTLTENAAPHDWLFLTGGAIGQGLPLATGAAIACPDRTVISLQADGSALYTLQALWTQARERTQTITVLLNNRRYAILQLENQRLSLDAQASDTAPLFDLGDPDLDFCKIAEGFGVKAIRAETPTQFDEAFESALKDEGPLLIEAVIG